jgi:hypothetical protein
MRAICALLVVLSPPSPAAEASQPTGGGLAERSKPLDRNGDGKLSAEGFPVAQFTQREKDNDGLKTLEEITLFHTGRRAGSDTPKPLIVLPPDFTVDANHQKPVAAKFAAAARESVCRKDPS